MEMLRGVESFTREFLAALIEDSVDADATVACLDRSSLPPPPPEVHPLRQRTRTHRQCPA
jgi:hypothetical protein